jgi:4'-phosphopantetheinyl transferase
MGEIELIHRLHLDESHLDLWMINTREKAADFLWNIELPGRLAERLSIIQSDSRKKEILATYYLVKEYLGAPTEVFYHSDGAPYLLERELKLSITHSLGQVAILFSREKEIGMDLEYCSDRILKLSSRFLSAGEMEAIPEGERLRYLTILWTMKESVVKLYRNRQLDFKTQILIDPFELREKGTSTARVFVEGDWLSCEMNYIDLGDRTMSYCMKH